MAVSIVYYAVAEELAASPEDVVDVGCAAANSNCSHRLRAGCLLFKSCRAVQGDGMVSAVERCVAAYATDTDAYLLCFTPDHSWGYAVGVEHLAIIVRSVRHPAELADRLYSEETMLLAGGDADEAAEWLRRLLEAAVSAAGEGGEENLGSRGQED